MTELFGHGARRGIGRAIAMALAGEGFDVAVNDVDRYGRVRATAAEISSLGVQGGGRGGRHFRLRNA